jgi:hypothetical protein
MKKILIEVSAGELIDKMTILEIKLEKIENLQSKIEIQREYDSLKITKKESLDIHNSNSEVVNNKELEKFYKRLKEINYKLWDIENKKRLCEKESDFKETFIKLSRDVHFYNDERAKIKLHINKITNSKIKEIKEYTKY